MGAINSALATIDKVGAEGDMDSEAVGEISFDLDGVCEPILLPDGKVIYPARLFGEPIHEIAARLIDSQDPARSRFLRLTGPPGTGKTQIARAIAHKLWTDRGHAVTERHGNPFYGFVEMSGGPSSDEFLFRYEYVPVMSADGHSDVKLVDSAFVTAMRNGWTVMLDEANNIREAALLSINSAIDGRLALYLPASGETVIAQPGFALFLAYNPGLLGSTDIPDAWRSRFPATLEVTSNWAALVKLGTPERLVAAAHRLDGLRLAGEDGLVWTPQFRDIESLTDMAGRVGERAAIGFFVSNLHEQVGAGAIGAAEGAAACRMLDEAGYGRLKVGSGSKIPNLHGYARAVAS